MFPAICTARTLNDDWGKEGNSRWLTRVMMQKYFINNSDSMNVKFQVASMHAIDQALSFKDNNLGRKTRKLSISFCSNDKLPG